MQGYQNRQLYQYYVHLFPHFLISSYGAPLAQRASYLVLLYSYFFGADGAINTITNSINNGLLNGSKCLPMVHTLTIVEPIWSILQKLWSLPIVP